MKEIPEFEDEETRDLMLEEEYGFLDKKEDVNLSDVGYIIISLALKTSATKKILDKEKVIAKDNFDSEGFVYSLWLTLDEKFKIIDKLCSVINFSKIFGAWGAPLDLVKKKAIRALIRYVIIPVICGLFKEKEKVAETEGKTKTKKAKK
jgi:hypothetical protein